MALPRPCLDCGRPSSGSRCADCSRGRQFGTGRPGTSASRGYDREWRKVRLQILVRDESTCRWCGGYADTVDHLVPLHQGGARLDPTNLVAACRSCNSGRTARPDF